MKIDYEIAQRIKDIDWFRNCGNKLNGITRFTIDNIYTVEEALYFCNTSKWEEITLDARNELTSYLREKYKSKYNEWNMQVKMAKDFIKSEVTPSIQKHKEIRHFDETFVSCVEWDVLGAIMEFKYRECKNRPTFFLELLRIYELGNFPCGWEGQYPIGRLIVF
jgi:hypothetical protein